jgi:hypothetical protein
MTLDLWRRMCASRIWLAVWVWAAGWLMVGGGRAEVMGATVENGAKEWSKGMGLSPNLDNLIMLRLFLHGWNLFAAGVVKIIQGFRSAMHRGADIR